MKPLYYLIILPIARLPMAALYRISDLVRIVITRIYPYRADVVRDNMTKAFPEWDKRDVHRQMNRFYGYFSDLLVEGLKGFVMRGEALDQRMLVDEPDWLREMAENGQSVLLTAGHYCNWEWFALACARHFKHQAVGVYLPLRNRFFNEKFYQARSRFGLELVTTKEFKDHLRSSKDKPCIYLMLTDQSPTNAKRAIWTEFLGRETAVQFGVEKYAKKHDLPVVYAEIIPVKRGTYRTEYKLLTAHPRETKKGEISRMHVKALEESILRDPSYWLWTHRRWKHEKRPEERRLY